MAAPSFLVTNYAGTTNTASDIIGLAEARLTAAGWVFVEEYAFTQNVGSTGTTTNGSTALAGVNAAALQNGWSVGGAGIPAGTTIVSAGGSTTPVMSQAATASASGVTLTASRAMRIWKNPASLNAAGADFHIAFVRDTTGGPRLAVRAFEGWDTTAKTIQNPAIVGSASSPAPNGTTFAANPVTNGVGTGSASWNPAGTTTPLMVDAIPPTNIGNNINLDVGVLASKSYLVLTIAGNGSSTSYAAWVLGLYNPNWADSQATYPPLMVADLLSTSTSGATTGVSRNLRVTTTGTAVWSAAVGPESLLLGRVTSAGLVREPASQTVRASRVCIGVSGPPFVSSSSYRGAMYDAMTVAVDSSLKIGDTVTVGATTWTVLAPYVLGPMFLVQIPTTVPVAYLFNASAGS